MEGHTGLGPFVAGEAEPPGEFKERVVDNVVCGSDRRFDILRAQPADRLLDCSRLRR